MSIRLNKLLAERGLGARRKCDTLIQSGVVRVNGRAVLEPGTMVEPDRDRVEVRGRPLPGRTALAYYVLHKPVGVISTLHDPEGRRTLRDFMPPGPHVFPVGRLDADTSGLLILTSDGELAHHLMHPRYGVSKLYRVHADRAPSPEMLRRLRDGIEFEPGVRSAPARVRLRDADAGECVLEIELHEGRYRQVRRMCEAAGLRVLRLHRWGYGPLRLAGVERGLWRELSDEEVRRLRSASARPHARPAGAGGPRRGRAESRPPYGGRAGRQADTRTPAYGGRTGAESRPPAFGGGTGRRADSRQPTEGDRTGRRGKSRPPTFGGRPGRRVESPPPTFGGRAGRHAESRPPTHGGLAGRRTESRPPTHGGRTGRRAESRPPAHGGLAGRRADSRPPRDGGRRGRPGSPESGRRGRRAAPDSARRGPRPPRFGSSGSPRSNRRDAPFDRQRSRSSQSGPRPRSRRPGGRPAGRRSRGSAPRRTFDR